MAKRDSKKPPKQAKRRLSHLIPKRLRPFCRRVWIFVRSSWHKVQAKVQDFQTKHPNPHRSFRRSYREDYVRETNTPGLMAHAALTFKELFRNWRTFGLLIILMVLLYIFGVGVMSQEFYQQFQDQIDQTSAELAGGKIGNFAKAGLLLISTVTSGGFDAGMGEAQGCILVMLFLILWLVTIFLLRLFMAGKQPKLRDALYNALAPILATFVLFVIIFLQLIPTFLAIIAYAAAIATNFLATPFYALLFFCFAGLMLTISGYLLSSSLMALVAVTAPGLYPLQALFAASDLMIGRRIKFVIRLLYALFIITWIYIISVLPVILLDLWLKSQGWLANVPVVPFWLMVTTVFAFIYFAAYFYLYYRWLLESEQKS